MPDEPDTVVLSCSDGYEELPEKVLEFFRYCVDRFEFKWLFKCDDDTYVVQERLAEILDLGKELVGSVHLDERGSPSGGAGYLLSRRVVGLLAKDRTLSLTGPEDIIIGEAAIRLGADFHATPRLWSMNDRFPTPDNDMITSHWCSPGRLRALHSMLYETPRIVQVTHVAWSDQISLYPSGYFCRHSTQCSGNWEETSGNNIVLSWFDWKKEALVPSGPADSLSASYRCVSIPSPSSEVIPFSEHPATGDTERAATTLAVFITTSKYGLPHLDRFLELNPGLSTHVVCTEIAPEGEARTRAWRNCDMPIRTWWFSQGRQLDFNHAVFIEWDVLFDDTLEAVFPGEADYYCRDLKKPGMPWGWFSNVPLLPESLQPFATGTPPMAVLRISRRCLEAIFSHPAADEAYSRDIQAELRFATLASACGYEPVECPGTLPNVSCWKASVGFGPSVWHSVKDRQTEFPRLPDDLKTVLFKEDPTSTGAAV